MARGKPKEQNSDGQTGKGVGSPPASTVKNTENENPSEENSDEPHSTESGLANEVQSDREKEKDLSHTKNQQQPVARTNTRKTASKQTDEKGTGTLETAKKGKEAFSLMKCWKLAVIPVITAFFILIVAILLSSPVPPDPGHNPDFNFPKIFENKIVELQSSFTNQTDRFWRIIKNRGLAHLRNTSPPQPLVLLLAAPPAAHSIVECFARKLAEALDPKHKRMLAIIDGREERSYPGEETKKKMDDLLIRSFKKGHRAALIHHLELLPPPSPLLFYSYCDDQNAPHKHVAIIFTVHLPAEPDASLEPKEAEGTVEKYLADIVWAKEDKDAVAALLSRVADTVALMNGEPSSPATC